MKLRCLSDEFFKIPSKLDTQKNITTHSKNFHWKNRRTKFLPAHLSFNIIKGKTSYYLFDVRSYTDEIKKLRLELINFLRPVPFINKYILYTDSCVH